MVALTPVLFTNELLGSKNGPFNADPFVVPRTVFQSDLRDAAKARAKTTGHGCFQREPALDLGLGADLCDGVHHRFRTAAKDAIRSLKFL